MPTLNANANAQAEFTYKTKPKAPAQWKQADDDQVPFVAILAPAELEKGTVRIKTQLGREAVQGQEEENRGEEVEIKDVVRYIKESLGNAV